MLLHYHRSEALTPTAGRQRCEPFHQARILVHMDEEFDMPAKRADAPGQLFDITDLPDDDRELVS